MSNHKEELMLWRAVILIGLGGIAIFALTQLLEPFTALVAFWIGIGLMCFGLIDVGVVMWRNREVKVKGIPSNVMKQYRKARMKIVRHSIRRMRHANSGVVWIWVVCLAGICVYAIAFYVLLYPTLELIGIVEGLTTWSTDATFTLNFCRTVLNWHPIIFIVGLLIWAFVNSQRREDVTYPAY
jgi:hypothetical protein